MGKFIAAVVAGILATVIGGLILNQLQGKRRGRSDAPGIAHLVASLPLEHAAPLRLQALSRA
jgi:hypothetical protein